jgi:hypothetical protein
MMDDYEMVKAAFKGVRSVVAEEDCDVEGNPILRVWIHDVKITFYFNVDVYRDEAELSNLIVEEVGSK